MSVLLVLISPRPVLIGRVFEFFDATAQAAHELRDFAASKQKQYDEDNQNDLCRPDGSHAVDFGSKFVEKNASPAHMEQTNPKAESESAGHVVNQTNASFAYRPKNPHATSYKRPLL